MAETFSFSEGTARFVTGGATSSAIFCTNINVVCRVGYYRYRAPHAGTYTFYITGQDATLSMAQLYSQKEIATIFNGQTAGGVHAQIIHAAAGVTGTLWLYSGVLDDMSIAGSEGNIMTRDVNGRFKTWSET